MLPKATLLGGAGTNFSFRFGSKVFTFNGGECERVPVAVALALQEHKMPGGKPLFKVEDLPKIVGLEEDGMERPTELKQINGPEQLRF